MSAACWCPYTHKHAVAVSIECRRSRNLEGTSVRAQNEIRRGGLVTFGGSNCRGRLLWRTLREDVTFCVCDCARLKREIGNGEGTVYCRRSGTSASQMGIGGEGGMFGPAQTQRRLQRVWRASALLPRYCGRAYPRRVVHVQLSER